MIAIVDINNSYISFERLFNPKLENVPCVVLSNGDSCIIARSPEAKILGLRMAEPLFQVKHIIDKHNVKIISSNYQLYADLSARFHEVTSSFGCRHESYSIDEIWLDLAGIDLQGYGQHIKDTIKRNLGLPVCVGISETKTLSKFCNFLAKKHPFLNGVCSTAELGLDRLEKAMQQTEVGELWGVGRKYSKRLTEMGIRTVYDLKKANARQLRKLFNINMEKTILELNGTPCIELEEYQEENKQLISSRSFGSLVTDKENLLASLTYHVEQAGKRLRKQGLYAREMVVFANSNRFNDDYISSSKRVIFPQALDSYRLMTRYLSKAVDSIYQSGVGYKKSGILLHDLISNEDLTRDLFDNLNVKNDGVLPTLEAIKKRFGKSSIQIASAKLADKWIMKRDHMSRNFTTDIKEILEVY